MIDAERMYFGETVEEGTPDYYLDDNGGLWKKEGNDHFYFSRARLEWVKSAIFYILPSWDYENVITDKDAEKILADYKADGKWEDEEIPMRYWANDNYTIFQAVDIFGKTYDILADMSLIETDHNIIGEDWESFSKEEIEEFVRKQWEKEEWRLVASGSQWKIYIDDYIGAIYKTENGYKAEISLDDNIDYPYVITIFESESLEELKEKAKDEIKKRTKIRSNKD